MKQNKQKGSIDTTIILILALITIVSVVNISQTADIKRLEKSDKCFEKLLVKNYDINYETDKINRDVCLIQIHPMGW